MTTKLFDKNKIRKFFDILSRLDGSVPIDKSHYPWKDYQTIYTKDSNHFPCTREVFVHRTVNKWLKGRYLILYKESDLGITYKQYISITSLSYHNNWGGGYISVGFLDYTKPFDSSVFGINHQFKIEHNDALHLEGEWCIDATKHMMLLNMIIMTDVPNKEYVFKAYDWSKYPKRKKKGIDPLDIMKTTKSFFAKTEHEAHKKKEQFERQSKDHKGQIIISELIDIKE